MEAMKSEDVFRRLSGEREPEESTEAERLKRTLLAFIAEESGMVKDLAAQSKKNLAREVVHLRGLVKTIKEATSRVRTSGPEFGHAEAFALMLYEEQDAQEGAAPRLLRVWNSRDGVTPFVVHVGEVKYQHRIRSMHGPFFDLPRDRALDAPTHVFVTRTDREVLECWDRILTKAVARGSMDQEKADRLRGDLSVAESWHLRIGLRDLATGRFTDEAAD